MASQNNKIQRVELSCYDAPIHCPFCGAGILTSPSDDDWVIEPCDHTLFIAHDDGFEYRSAHFDKLKGISEVANDDVDLGEEGLDGFTDDISVENSIKIAIYIPAPSFFGAYFWVCARFCIV